VLRSLGRGNHQVSQELTYFHKEIIEKWPKKFPFLWPCSFFFEKRHCRCLHFQRWGGARARDPSPVSSYAVLFLALLSLCRISRVHNPLSSQLSITSDAQSILLYPAEHPVSKRDLAEAKTCATGCKRCPVLQDPQNRHPVIPCIQKEAPQPNPCRRQQLLVPSETAVYGPGLFLVDLGRSKHCRQLEINVKTEQNYSRPPRVETFPIYIHPYMSVEAPPHLQFVSTA
jgi:hypothetical protein